MFCLLITTTPSVLRTPDTEPPILRIASPLTSYLYGGARTDPEYGTCRHRTSAVFKLDIRVSGPTPFSLPSSLFWLKPVRVELC